MEGLNWKNDWEGGRSEEEDGKEEMRILGRNRIVREEERKGRGEEYSIRYNNIRYNIIIV